MRNLTHQESRQLKQEIVTCVQNGCGYREASTKFKVPAKYVKNACRAARVPDPSYVKQRGSNFAKIIELRQLGLTCADIGRELGISKHRANQIAKSENLGGSRGALLRDAILELADDPQVFSTGNIADAVGLSIASTARILGKQKVAELARKRNEKRLKKYVGKPFHRLTITNVESGKKGQSVAICDCSCGTRGFRAYLRNVTRGFTKSCGCLYREYIGQLKGNGFGWH